MTRPNSAGADGVSMQPRPPTDMSAGSSELEKLAAFDPGLPVAPSDPEKLARWVPKKEMALLLEICERAQRDPDLMRPALLLCAAYGERVARMLDQYPFPGIPREIANRLEELCVENGL